MQGIGAATGILFAKAGCNVILAARREDKLREVKAAALEAAGSNSKVKVLTVTLDVQDKDAVEGFLDKLPAEWRNIDVLVNNAGLVYGREPVGELNFTEVEIMISMSLCASLAAGWGLIILSRHQRCWALPSDEQDRAW